MISLHRTALLSLALLATLTPARGLQDPEAIEISINEITSIDWRPGQELPDGITSLNGKTVSIEGYMALDGGGLAVQGCLLYTSDAADE